MPDTLAPDPFPNALAPETLLNTLFTISLTGILLLRPIYDASGSTIVDLGWEQLNPAAQQMLRLPARPGASFLTLFPTAKAAGVFGFYCNAFLSGQVERHQTNYQHDGLDGYYLLVAQRQGDTLVVSFTDTNEHPRQAVEEELRQSQARELEAHAAAERQRGELQRVFEQAPVAIAVYRGPQYVIELANPVVCSLWGRTAAQIIGLPLFVALPEVAGMGYEELLDQVMATGEPYVAHAMPAVHEREGRRDTVYWDFVYVPMYAEDGAIYGAMVVATEVTRQVLARQQVQQLNEELAAINEELRATNDEYLGTNAALIASQQQLHTLTQELEARVQQRTQEARAATAEAERQRSRLARFFQQAPAAICVLDGPELVYELVNPGYQQLFPGRALLGKPLLEALPELVDQPVWHTLQRVYQTGETHLELAMHIPVARHEGGPLEDFYFNYIQQARTNEQGQVDGVLVFVTEVTEQVLARQQRDAQQRRLQQLFEQAPVAIFVLQGPQYVLEVVNPAMSELLGHPVAALLDKPFFEAVPELAGQGYPELLAQVWRTGEPVVLAENPARLARHQPEEVGYFTFIYQPLFDAANQLTDVLCVALDVTAQVLARQQVQALNEAILLTNSKLSDTNTRLLRTNADLDTFVYTASHDLKSPITNIEGLLAALREHLPANAFANALVPRLLDMMGGAVERFQQTLGHLTAVSRLQQAQDQPTEAVDLPALVEAVRLDILPELTAAGATLQVELASCDPIRFSPKNLRSIIYNLLSNAIKYRALERPPQVWLRCYPTPGHLVLEVQDNGLGLSAQQQEELFRMFRRLHNHVAGSGVGLYMVKKMVENAGGTVAVRSQPGVGSTFAVSLPAGE